MTDESWMDITPETSTPVTEVAPTIEPAEIEEWMRITDPLVGKVTLAFQNLVDACMRGTNRVMACDGSYMAYRPFNRAFDKEVNPRTAERFRDFIDAGHYKHVGTYDEVQIWELLEGSPYKHKGSYVAGTDYWKDIRQAAKLACERNWPDYHDYLGAMATALKSGRDPGFAKTMWGDTLNQVAISIKQIGGATAPSEREVNEGFTGVRKARGISKGGVIATLDSSGLARVGFAK